MSSLEKEMTWCHFFVYSAKKKKTPPTVGVVVAVVAPRHVHHLVRHADVLGVGPKVFRRGHGHELHRPLLPERLVRLGHGQGVSREDGCRVAREFRVCDAW